MGRHIVAFLDMLLEADRYILECHAKVVSVQINLLLL
jgi:hypothetical protein